MINSFQDFQKVSKAEMTDYMQSMGELNKSWQAIATEMTDYSKRSFEDGVATFQKLAAAKSVPEAMEIQTTYAKSAYEELHAADDQDWRHVPVLRQRRFQALRARRSGIAIASGHTAYSNGSTAASQGVAVFCLRRGFGFLCLADRAQVWP